MEYSKEAIMMAMLAAELEKEKAEKVIYYLEVAPLNAQTEAISKQYKRWLLSVGSYNAIENRAKEYEQDIIY